jgi:hypothetical protein
MQTLMRMFGRNASYDDEIARREERIEEFDQKLEEQDRRFTEQERRMHAKLQALEMEAYVSSRRTASPGRRLTDRH